MYREPAHSMAGFNRHGRSSVVTPPLIVQLSLFPDGGIINTQSFCRDL